MAGKRFIISGERWRMEEGLRGYGCQYRYNSIMNYLCERHGFIHRNMISREIYPYERLLDVEPLPSDTELIYVWMDTHSNNFADIVKIFDTVPKAKIIWLVGGDRRTWHWESQKMRHRVAYRPGMKKFLERVNVILDFQVYGWKKRPQDTTFAICHPQFAHKHVFYINNFSPDEHFMSLKYKRKPIQKCLFHGRPGGRYELRNYVIERLAKNLDLRKHFDIIKHPNFKNMTEENFIEFASVRKNPMKRKRDIDVYGAYVKLDFLKKEVDDEGNIVGANYARVLNRYYCSLGINGGRRVNIVLVKHLEIAASGALLLSERFPDMDMAGFIPGKHYVEVEANYLTEDEKYYVQSDIIQKTVEVIQHPKKYEDVRKEGTEFVRKNHSETARFKFLDEIIERLLSGETIFRNYPKIKELGEK